jgi:hypothetical protein
MPENLLPLLSPLGINWEHFATYTDAGTLLVRSTLEAAGMDLDQWAWLQRSGIEVSSMPKGTRIHVAPWKSILSHPSVGLFDDVRAGNLTTAARKKLFSQLETDLDTWQEHNQARVRAAVPSMDPKEAATAIKNLHSTFQKWKSNELEIGMLAAFYTADHGGDPDENKNLITAVLKQAAATNVFSKGAGGAPKVRRLQTAQGKPTGLDAFDTTRKPRKGRGGDAE